MPSCTHYDILGIRPWASIEEVRRAYRRKALATHPDKLDQNATEEDKRNAETRFRMIREAFEVLGDSSKRRNYDIHLNSTQQDRPNPADDLQTKMKDREDWARKQDEEYKRRMEQLRGQRRETYGLRREQKKLPNEVQEIVDAINVAINEARPGWLDRMQKAQKIKADWDSGRMGQRV